jgi:hypothetical protein
MHNNDVLVVFLVVAAVVMVKLLKGPLGHAIADRLRGAAPPDSTLVDELETVKARLAEVEERLDFAERLLAKGEQAGRLPGRGDT